MAVENARHKRAVPARRRYTDVARYFVHRGFAVLVLTRLGYGDAGLSPDPEFSGSKCSERNFDIGVAALIEQTRAAVDFAGTLPFADTRRTILVGQSYGGLGTIAATGKNLPGVIAAINFSGGAGGDCRKPIPAGRVLAEEFTTVAQGRGQPCAHPDAVALFGKRSLLGHGVATPMVRSLTRQAAGRRKCRRVPAVGKEGHTLLARGFQEFVAAARRSLPRRRGGLPPTAASAKKSFSSNAARSR